MIRISCTLFTVIALLACSCNASAALIKGNFIGLFAGNDSEGAIFTETGDLVTMLDKVEDPDTSSGQLSINVTSTKTNGEPLGGDWTYTGTQLVDYFVVKAGDQWALYQYTGMYTPGMENMGLWDTDDITGDSAMSHVAAYAIIPEPTSLILFGTFVSAFGIRRRR